MFAPETNGGKKITLICSKNTPEQYLGHAEFIYCFADNLLMVRAVCQ